MPKSADIKELFDIVATNLSVFSREVVSQKDTLTDITLRIDAMRSDDSLKTDIIKNNYHGEVYPSERSRFMTLRARLFAFWMKKRPKSLSAMKIIAITFAGLILLGAVLLGYGLACLEGSERWLWAGIGIFDFVYAGIISQPLWRKKD